MTAELFKASVEMTLLKYDINLNMNNVYDSEL